MVAVEGNVTGDPARLGLDGYMIDHLDTAMTTLTERDAKSGRQRAQKA